MILANSSSDLDTKALMVNLHTLKGEARSAGLSLISARAHQAEEHLVKTYSQKRPSDRTQLLADINAIEATIDYYTSINESKLNRNASKIELSDLGLTQETLLEHLRQPPHDEASRLLRRVLTRAFCENLQQIMQNHRNDVVALAARLGKPIPEIIVKCGGAILTPSGVDLCNNVLPHLLGNSLDHGLEPEAERLSKGKSPIGQIMLSGQVRGDQLEIQYSDDGRGLDLAKIREKAKESQIIGDDGRPGGRKIIDWIFLPGFSTANVQSSVSGRGVGLDAVRSIMLNKGGRIDLVLLPGSDELVGFKIVLTLPGAFFVPDLSDETVREVRASA